MPRAVRWAIALLTVLSLLPLALVARARRAHSRVPRIHLIPDMDNQDRAEPQTLSPVFADGRAMRPPVPGTLTVAGPLRQPGETEATALPFEPTPATLERGRERYDLFCQPCHGLAGRGDGMVHERAAALGEGAWVAPSDLHSQGVTGKPVGYYYGVVADGVRTMPGYAPQIPAEDRWAIAAYLVALQRSQDASLEDVPPEQRATLEVTP
ncbi:MAG: cytochrome c [Pseudomonadota bacterium]